jgi:hypothetical protein
MRSAKHSPKFYTIFLIILPLLLVFGTAQQQYCSHPIFCNQTILQTISDSNLFQSDFKEFVDLVLKVPV